MSAPPKTADTPTDHGGKPILAIEGALRRLKEAVEVGAEAVGQVIRGQGVKLPSRKRGETRKGAKLQKLLDRIRADAANHGLRAILAAASEVEVIRSLSDDEIRQAETVLRALQAELSTIRTYAHERLRAIQAGQRGSDVTLLMLTIDTFKTLDRAVDAAVARLPAKAAADGTNPAPQDGNGANPGPQVAWRPRPPRYRPPKDGWG